jgi:hypothetical protein
VPLAHFTTWDCNWPYGPPDDAVAPDEPAPQTMPSNPRDCEERKCTIQVGNGTLGERIPLSGVPFALNYRSDRVPGRVDARTLRIPVSGESVSASLQSIEVRVSVAGQRVEMSFPPSPHQTYEFTWDGKDGYGRPLQGSAKIGVSIGYVYGAVYQEAAAVRAAFARFSGAGVSLVASRRESTYTIWRRWSGWIGILDQRATGLGGWSSTGVTARSGRRSPSC